MTKEKLTHFKTKLLDEKKLLETELKTVGIINPDNPLDWEAKPQTQEIDIPDNNDLADKVEGFETNIAILNTLETKYNTVKDALEKIEENTYGVCAVCGKAIEEDRLEANPAAKTCKADINS